MNEANKNLALHCRFGHFTALTVSLAVVIAIGANTNKKLSDTLDEVEEIRLVQEHWPDMRQLVGDEVSVQQGAGTKFEVFTTVKIAGEPYDLLLNIDLNRVWVPHHKHLYDNTKPYFHYNQLANGGDKVSEFETRWDWISDLIWIYVPTSVAQLVTVERALIGDRWVTVNETTQATCTLVDNFSQDSSRGQSRFLCMVDVARNRLDGLIFGEFPSEHAVEAGKGYVTISGSGGKPPPLYRQVELEMHIHQEFRTRCFERSEGKISSLENNEGLRLIELKIPTKGECFRVAPLLRQGNKDGKQFIAGEKFSSRYPLTSRLHKAYRNIKVEQLSDILTEQYLSGEDRVLEVIGLRIPFNLVARWGIVLVFAVYCYFAIHIDMLARRLAIAEATDIGWNTPWIALYEPLLSYVVSLLTAVIIPCLAVFLYVFLCPTPDDIFSYLLMYGSLTGILVLSVLVTFALHRIRILRKARQNENIQALVQTPSPLIVTGDTQSVSLTDSGGTRDQQS